MTETEVVFYFGQLFASYLIGFGSGFLIHSIRKLSEYI